MRFLPAFFLLSAAAACGQSVPDRQLFDAIRRDDTALIAKLLASGASPNAVDDAGATALMHAALYASDDCVKLLLDKGATVNTTTPNGSTALMWATGEESKVKLLLARGANPSLRNKKELTAAYLAARRPGGESIARLLTPPGHDPLKVLQDGLDPVELQFFTGPPSFFASVRAIGSELTRHRGAGASPLLYAAELGNGAMVRGMLDAGADPKQGLLFATLAGTPLTFAAYGVNLDGARLLASRGVNINAKSTYGFTPLMIAAGSEHQNEAMVRWLLANGADLSLRDDEGRTALDWALAQGETPIARLLRDAGAKPGAPFTPPKPRSSPPLAPREAIAKAIGLLQPVSPAFSKAYGVCISCHNNSLPEIAVKSTRDKGIPIDETLASHPAKATLTTWSPNREDFQLGLPSVGGWVANVSYGLVALSEDNVPPDATTDAIALSLARHQEPDGTWHIPDLRPPLGGSRIMWTALVVRGAGAYMPPGRANEWQSRVRKAREFLLHAQPRDIQDRAFQILGLRWSGASIEEINPFASALAGLQKPDGGWAQLPTMSSDAYATGEALYALRTAGKMLPSSGIYQHGARFLLASQLDDGSWFVRRRSFGFQPYRDTGFPHGRDQFISAAATSWAVIALTPAIAPRP